jgi:hypothetical protein
MLYEFKCENNHTTDLIQPMKDPLPPHLDCEVCGKKAVRDWVGSMITIPDHFKASNQADDLTNPSVLGPRLNRTRPSGKSKIYY